MAQEIGTGNAIPAYLGKERRSLNIRYLVGGVLLLLLVGYLGFSMIRATTTTGAYYMTVSEVYGLSDLQGQRIRVNGIVVDDSEDWNAQEITLRFSIADESGDQMPIVFYGPRPDNFQRAASAIVEGELLADGTFKADTLLLKCPSRYEEDPEEIFVEATR